VARGIANGWWWREVLEDLTSCWRSRSDLLYHNLTYRTPSRAIAAAIGATANRGIAITTGRIRKRLAKVTPHDYGEMILVYQTHGSFDARARISSRGQTDAPGSADRGAREHRRRPRAPKVGQAGGDPTAGGACVPAAPLSRLFRHRREAGRIACACRCWHATHCRTDALRPARTSG